MGYSVMIYLLLLVSNIEAFAGKCEQHLVITNPVTSCICPVEWTREICETPTNVLALRHDFGDRSDMTVSGNLRQWPEIGENGEAGIGRIKSNETFQLTRDLLVETGKSACVSFFYRREKTGSTLKVYYTSSGIPMSLWNSMQDVFVNKKWNEVTIDLLGLQYMGNVVLTIVGNTTPSSGFLDIDDILIVDLACSLVSF